MKKSGRPLKKHLPNSLHHVMMRGNNRQNIFHEKKYFERFIKIIAESTEKFDHKIVAFCLMTNHVHLVIHVQNDPLSEIMQNIAFRYAKWANHQLKNIWHLFQGRYKSIIVQDEHYLINLCRYIHFNPVEAGIAENILSYPWSSHRYYLSANTPKWLSLSVVKQAVIKHAGTVYIEFMSQLLQRNTWKPILTLNIKNEIIIHDNITKEFIKNQNNNKKHTFNFLEPTEVIDLICKYFQIPEIVFYGKRKTRNIAKIRVLTCHYLSVYSALSMAEICRKFNRTQATLSRQLINLVSNNFQPFSTDDMRNIQQKLENLDSINKVKSCCFK